MPDSPSRMISALYAVAAIAPLLWIAHANGRADGAGPETDRSMLRRVRSRFALHGAVVLALVLGYLFFVDRTGGLGDGERLALVVFAVYCNLFFILVSVNFVVMQKSMMVPAARRSVFVWWPTAYAILFSPWLAGIALFAAGADDNGQPSSVAPLVLLGCHVVMTPVMLHGGIIYMRLATRVGRENEE